MIETPLDRAHEQMQASPDDDQARLHFYERLADGELFVLLEAPAAGDQIAPRLFPVDGASIALAFDREDRLAEFAGSAADYAALSGRRLAEMLSGAGLGLGVNLDVAPSAIILPPDAVQWLDETLSKAPGQIEAHPDEILAPKGLPDQLILALDTKLGLAAGLAKFAYLCAVRYADSTHSHMLAFVDPVAGSEDALAGAVNEALVFSGIEAGALDVAFFAARDPMAAKLARVGLRFDLPEPAIASLPAAPGSNPAKPPILR